MYDLKILNIDVTFGLHFVMSTVKKKKKSRVDTIVLKKFRLNLIHPDPDFPEINCDKDT